VAFETGTAVPWSPQAARPRARRIKITIKLFIKLLFEGYFIGLSLVIFARGHRQFQAKVA
jgi:hypothetical protein